MRVGTIILGGIAALTVAGYVYYKTQIKKLSNIKVNPSKYRFRKLSFNDALLDIDLDILNESNFDITVKSYDIDAYVNESMVAKLKNNVNQIVKASGNSLITVSIAFNPKLVLKGILTADIIKGVLFDKSKILITLNGHVSVSGSGVLTVDNIPVNYSKPLSAMVTG